MKLREYIETTLTKHLAGTPTRNLYGTRIFCGGMNAVGLAERYGEATGRAWATNDGLNEMAGRAADAAMEDLYFSEYDDDDRDGDLDDQDRLSERAFMAACDANADIERIGAYWWFDRDELESAMLDAATEIVNAWKHEHANA